MFLSSLSVKQRFLLVALVAGLAGLLAGWKLVAVWSTFPSLLTSLILLAGLVGLGLVFAKPTLASLAQVNDACRDLARKDIHALVERPVSSEFQPLLKGLDEVKERFFWYVGLLDAIPFPLSVTDVDMNWTFINKPVEMFLGVKREDIVGKQCNNWNADICRTENCGIERLRKGNLQTLFNQQGRNFQVDTAYLHNSRGARTGHVEVVQEITDKIKAFNYQKTQVEHVAVTLKQMVEGNFTVTNHLDDGDQYTKEVREHFLRLNENLNQVILVLNETLSQVTVAADQVTSAAGQISSGSQALSQNASEQASAIEEVSSSLEEMASMSKLNASNAKEAQGLCDAARIVTVKSAESMERLSEAINRIKNSSDATSKIVKTIDEIAFQTNLLALNAAVEAARAGDAGKGFAVVAEEVRNLAIRSAEAAKNTANLIEESVKNAGQGVEINQEALQNLEGVKQQVTKVSEMMAEIASASDQQSLGVEQITDAVSQMTQMTQNVAASAEESASAAEELSGQSVELASMVARFKLKGGSPSDQPASRAVVNQHPREVALRKKATPAQLTRAINDARQLIPLEAAEDQDAWKDF